MSNFSALFSNLRDTVQEGEGGEEKASKKTITPPIRKRPREEKLPHDHQDLTIQLSFLCIGAQKAGTTWLHEMLQHHPNLCLPVDKEVHFFDWKRKNGLGWYSHQFMIPKSALRKQYLGEITPCYAILPESSIQEIKVLFPNIKLIFVARSLVERAWSAILMELRNASRGMAPGEFPDKTKPQIYDPMEDPNRYDDEYFMQRLLHPTHTNRSDYATALRRWFKYFPPQQILILHFPDISRDPELFLQRVCAHIGVSSTDLLRKLNEGDVNKKVNAATGPSSNFPLNPRLRQRFEQYLDPFTRDFNLLLEEFNYPWRLTTSQAIDE